MSSRICWYAALTVASLFLIACSEPDVPLAQHAYVWQYDQGQAVAEAMGKTADIVTNWHVLAGVVDRSGRLRQVKNDLHSLRSTGRKVVLVFRVHTGLSRVASAKAISSIVGTVSDFPAELLAGVEIDHDSPTSKLTQYRDFLAMLKPALPPVPLSATMLPTWLGSPDFEVFSSVPDGLVLQVHAVQDPSRGLFDASQATRWIRDLARRTSKPFLVALPCYGSRVNWGEDGVVSSVESEVEGLAGGRNTSELYASPLVVADFLRDLNGRRPAALKGIVWFRLPTANDQRAWSIETWRSVVQGTPLVPRIAQLWRPVSGSPRSFDGVLKNDSGFDVDPPVTVPVPAGCTVAGGTNGYVSRPRGSGYELVRERGRLMSAGSERVVGWARCTM